MRRIGRILVLAAASVIVAGTVASAAPGLRATVVSAFDTATGASGVSGATGVSAVTGATTATGGSDLTGTSGPSGGSGLTGTQRATGGTMPSGPSGATAPSGPSGQTGPVEAPVDGEGAGPDFSACLGLTGLDNAICRHEVLLAADPDNHGLRNALDHLLANRDRHDDGDDGSGHDGNHGSSDEHGNSGNHGSSGEHGNSDDHGNPNGR
jgi:hypothetical protein